MRTGSANGQLSAAVRGFLSQAESHYQAAQQALKQGDFATYGQQLQLMKQALDEANRAAQQSAKPGARTPTPTPTPDAMTASARRGPAARSAAFLVGHQATVIRAGRCG